MRARTASRLAASVGALTSAMFLATAALGVSRRPGLPQGIEPFSSRMGSRSPSLGAT